MRDTSDGICGVRKKKPSPRTDSATKPSPRTDSTTVRFNTKQSPRALVRGPDWCDLMDRKIAGAGHPPHAAQTLHRLPSPGLSSQDLSPQSLGPASSSVLQGLDTSGGQNLDKSLDAARGRNLQENLVPRGNQVLEELAKLRQLETPESAYPGELPNNFFGKLSELMAMDQEIQNKIISGETRFFTGKSCRSRFLQACIKGEDKSASSLWRSICLQDKQDLLLAYSCGPPSSDFFVNMMSSHDSTSDCGSSSTEFESGSDSTNTSWNYTPRRQWSC